MAKRVRRYISELLQAYQEITGKTCIEMALDFEISPSNLYLYRTGCGNPTADTIDKIIDGVERDCPEVIKKVPNVPEEVIVEGQENGDL